jgi:hypothetical protein
MAITHLAFAPSAGPSGTCGSAAKPTLAREQANATAAAAVLTKSETFETRRIDTVVELIGTSSRNDVKSTSGFPA